MNITPTWIQVLGLLLASAALAVESFGSERLKEDLGVLGFVVLLCGVLVWWLFAMKDVADQDAKDRELQRRAWRAQIALADKKPEPQDKAIES